MKSTPRTDEHIDHVLEVVKQVWRNGRNRHQRLGQLLTNASYSDLFYAQDKDLVENLRLNWMMENE